ncbi:MAG: hypothetical protein DI616_04145 [Paracoccus denitrificans]|uniref:Uncharacterized protein n=1 Tax=Paracoccus denitrificans TaxID=266 RepID=A0A533ICK1_PARDE|nr:MAG: hypothetical protein DI616_04145 [Paracoccus denitrificans]
MRPVLFGIAALAMMQANVAFGQAAEACGISEELLLHCTLDNGTRQLGLCLSGNRVSYAFGPDFTAPELTMLRDLTKIEYHPFAWASRTIFESVTLMNADTSYEIWSSAERHIPEGQTEGGVIVTLPNAEPRHFHCDQGSVWPPDPIDGLGLLNTVVPGADG